MWDENHVTIEDCEVNMMMITKQQALIKAVFIVLSIVIAVFIVMTFFYWHTKLMTTAMIIGVLNIFAFLKLDVGLFKDYKYWYVKMKELSGEKSILKHDDK